MQAISIRPTINLDLADLVELSLAKRLAYAKAQPTFWCYRGPEGDAAQLKYFHELLHNKQMLLFTAVNQQAERVGFVIGQLVQAPEVYQPGGLILKIDDFCVNDASHWELIGGPLLTAIKQAGKARGATLVLVVCGAQDQPKREFLQHHKLAVASEWYVSDLS